MSDAIDPVKIIARTIADDNADRPHRLGRAANAYTPKQGRSHAGPQSEVK